MLYIGKDTNRLGALYDRFFKKSDIRGPYTLISYLFRYMRVILLSWFKTKMAPLEMSTVSFIAWPFDCEMKALNGARAMAIMDNARMDFVARTGMMKAMFKNGWLISIGSQRITYFKPVPIFSRFLVEARILAWEDRWFICECKIISKGKVAAIGHQRCLLGGKKGVTAQQVLKELSYFDASPALPQEVADWIELETRIYNSEKS